VHQLCSAFKDPQDHEKHNRFIQRQPSATLDKKDGFDGCAQREREGNKHRDGDENYIRLHTFGVGLIKCLSFQR
jgi:hypothetical protein